MNKIEKAVREEFPPVIEILDNTFVFEFSSSLIGMINQLRDEEGFHINYFINAFKDFDDGEWLQINIAGEEVCKIGLSPDIKSLEKKEEFITEMILTTIKSYKDKINEYDARLQEKIDEYEEKERYVYLMYYYLLIESPKALYYAKKAVQKCPVSKYEFKLSRMYKGQGRYDFCYKNPALGAKVRRQLNPNSRSL